MMTIWKCLVQPKLDYCSQLWSPDNQTDITQLENVQRHFTSRIAGMEGRNYWERLQDLKLSSQERRRERYQVFFIWKLSQNLVKGYNLEFKRDNRQGRLAIEKSISRRCATSVSNARQSTLAMKGVKIFNMLPKEIRDVNSLKVDSFKNCLDEYLSNVLDQPTIPGSGRAATTNSLLCQLPLMRIN